MLRADLLSCVPASSSESEVFAGENNFLPLFSAVRYLTNNLPRESSATSFSTDALPDLPNLQNGEAVAPPTPGPGLLLGFIWEPLSTESSVLSKTPSSVKKAGFHAMLFLRLKPPSFFFLFVETVPSARSVLFSWSWQMFSLSQVSMGSGGESIRIRRRRGCGAEKPCARALIPPEMKPSREAAAAAEKGERGTRN